MESYQTEEQQVEAIKKFWNENGNSLIVGVVLGLAGFAGYGYYQDSKMAEEVAIADSYISNVEKNIENKEQFAKTGEQLIKAHQNSSYAAMTAFALAKQAVDAKDWKKAQSALEQAQKLAPDAGMKSLAALRLARINVQLEQYDQALALVKTNISEAYKGQAEEIKGDIYLLQGKKELARTAYQAALDAGADQSSSSLQMKLDDLADNV